MLTKEDISDSIILERLYSAISKIEKCMNCNITKPIYLDIYENRLKCRKCCKYKDKCKLIGIDKINMKELKRLEKNINQSFLRKRSGFSLKNLISRYLGQRTKEDELERINNNKRKEDDIDLEEFSDIGYEDIRRKINYRRSTSDFYNLYKNKIDYNYRNKNFSMEDFNYMKFDENRSINNSNMNNCINNLFEEKNICYNNKCNKNNEYIKPNLLSKNPFDFC